MTHISAIASVFPYDPAIDTGMDHQHLILAYGLVWFVHLCYLGYVGKKWHVAKRQQNPLAKQS